MTKIGPEHLARRAFVYVRQSTADQLRHNHESRRRQYALADRARMLGWSEVVVIDDGCAAGTVHASYTSPTAAATATRRATTARALPSTMEHCSAASRSARCAWMRWWPRRCCRHYAPWAFKPRFKPSNSAPVMIRPSAGSSSWRWNRYASKRQERIVNSTPSIPAIDSLPVSLNAAGTSAWRRSRASRPSWMHWTRTLHRA